MILPFDYIGYKRLSENKRFPNHRWYSDATWWGGGGNVLHLMAKSKGRKEQNTQKTKDRATRTPLQTGGDLKCVLRKVKLFHLAIALSVLRFTDTNDLFGSST